MNMRERERERDIENLNLDWKAGVLLLYAG